MGILNWLFGQKKVDREVTTEGFNIFYDKYRQLQKERVRLNRWKGWESHDNLLVRYIIEKKLSPFEGDSDLQEARKFLKENGVMKKII